MKLTIQDMKKLMVDTHIHDLTKEQLVHLGMICSLPVSNYKKGNTSTTFYVANENRLVRVETEPKIRCITIKKKAAKMGTCFGGTYTYAEMHKVLVAFVYGTIELTMKTSKCPPYSSKEFEQLFGEASKYIL